MALGDETDALGELGQALGVVAWEFLPGSQQLKLLSGPTERLFGLSNQALREEPRAWLARVHFEDRPTAELARKAMDRAPQDITIRIHGAGGVLRWMRCRAAPSHDGTRVLGLCELAAPGRHMGPAEYSSVSPAPPEMLDLEPTTARSEERYATFVDSAQDAIWCMEAVPPIPLDQDPALLETRFLGEVRLAECNPAFASAFLPQGFQQPFGRRLAELPMLWLPGPRALLRRLIESRFAPSSDRMRVQNHRGKHLLMQVRTRSVVHGGAFHRAWCTARDVTEETLEAKRLAASEAEARALLASSLAGVAILDRHCRLLTGNQALAGLLGLDLSACRGERLSDCLGSDPDRLLERLLHEARAQGHAVREGSLQRRDEGQLDLELSAAFQDGDNGHYYVFARDVGPRMRAQRELREQQVQLGQLSRLQTVGEMATRVAHELNQPLAAIVNYTQGSLRRLPDDPTWEPVRRALGAASDQAHRAAASVKRLRSFVSPALAVRSEVDLGSILESAMTLIAHQPAAAGHRVTSQFAVDGLQVLADPNQLQQVFLSLLQNAVEACGNQSGRILLSAERSETNPAWVEVSISDDGPGISDGDFDRLFAPFESSKPGSLGLGLSISRTVVETHGGQVSCVQSTPRGTTFVVRLPLSLPQPS